ncbi:MAG: DUF5011 domain-containing protein, partial [Spirochaetales bacterium]|nr:DUF5011 domain-containing protein [Spirochaetales bacterium]
MKKITVILIVILSVIMLISCPGIGEDPPEDDPAPPEASNNANLSAVTVTAGNTEYIFTTIESSYSITVGYTIESITVAPVLSDPDASLVINGTSFDPINISIVIPVSEGDNIFTIIVTAEDGETTNTHTFTISRLAAVDINAPVITLLGDNPFTMEVNTTFTDPGATATDNEEGNLSSAVVVTGTVNTATVGTYTLYYNVSDSSGNAAMEVSRIVNVAEALEAPIVSPDSGNYTSPQTVTITHPTPEVRIYYTFDATWFDDETTGTLYEGPLTISSHTTVTIRAFHDNYNPSWAVRSYAIVSPGETNMIANGDFSDGLVLWRFYPHTEVNAEASFEVVDGVFTTYITDGGYKDWHIHVHYRPRFLLEQDEYYQLDFTAWAAEDRQIGVQLHEEGFDNNGDGSSYSNYYGNTINLTTSPQQFSFSMRMDDIDDPYASLRLNLGIDTADVYIDDITLEKIVPIVVDPLDFPDPELRNALATAVGKSFSEITDMDLATLEELGTRDEESLISNLTGIEYCEDLRGLYSESSDVSNYLPLAG